VVSQAGPFAEDAGVSLSVEEGPSPGICALADPQRLGEVLGNLISNGVKYNRKGGAVVVSFGETQDGSVRIDITDTGIGIAPECMSRLWDPFERLGAEQGGIQGTGLGLSVAKAVMEAMGGSIRAKSEAGAGSTFTVELPRAELPEGREVAEGRKVPAGKARRAVTVLHIEDNRQNLLLVESVLKLRPEVDLLEATTGRAGVDLALERRPELILLDLHLPDISGEECLRMLKEDERTRDIPVVVVSATAQPEKIEAVLAAGAASYLTKPLDVQRVLDMVDDIAEIR
jgi:CheY-like chemotaxis protein/anti-sigma regulatory factor (Ser/Thr protein kinase)